MKVVVCGSRNGPKSTFIVMPEEVYREMDRLHAELRITDLMQGGNPCGVDGFARRWATTKPEIRRWVCKAEWIKFGPAAGPIRNRRMVEWHRDIVIGFPGDRGTADMIAQAEAAGIPLRRVLQPAIT
jgi:hypothetical protein